MLKSKRGMALTCKAGLKLLGFKDSSELAFEDNIKHSFFIYPDELVRLFFYRWCRGVKGIWDARRTRAAQGRLALC